MCDHHWKNDMPKQEEDRITPPRMLDLPDVSSSYLLSQQITMTSYEEPLKEQQQSHPSDRTKRSDNMHRSIHNFSSGGASFASRLSSRKFIEEIRDIRFQAFVFPLAVSAAWKLRLVLGDARALRVTTIIAMCCLSKVAVIEGHLEAGEAHMRAAIMLVTTKLTGVPVPLWLFIIGADLRPTMSSTRNRCG
nr:hypothetical protein CFP56_21691 [Quercus suber]